MSSSDTLKTTDLTHTNAVQTSVDSLEEKGHLTQHKNIVPPTNLSETECCARTMTKKGLEYSIQTKKK